MKKRFVAALAALTILVLLLSPALAAAESAPVETTWTTRIGARFATVEEGQQWMRDRTLFHDQITETMLPFFLQKKGGTLKEYIEYSEAQVMAFTPEEEQRVLDVLDWLQGELKAHGLELPDPGEITFVKTTGQEAVGSAGYTSEGTVFLAWFTFSPEYYTDETFREIVVHELSHCLSRLFPEYRQALYSLIHFTVLDQDILGNLVEYICQDTDDTTWMVGEKTGEPFRKMDDPEAFGQPKSVWGLFYVPRTNSPNTVNDRGGVHFNSSLLNLIAARLCTEYGMSYEDAVSFWIMTAMGLTPRTDYIQMGALLN